MPCCGVMGVLGAKVLVDVVYDVVVGGAIECIGHII